MFDIWFLPKQRKAKIQLLTGCWLEMSKTWCTPGFLPTRPASAAQSEIVHIVIGWGFNQWHLMVVALIGMVFIASCDQSPFKEACRALLWVLPDVNTHRNCQHHGKEDGLKCQKLKYDLYKFLHLVVSTDVEMFMTLSVIPYRTKGQMFLNRFS